MDTIIEPRPAVDPSGGGELPAAARADESSAPLDSFWLALIGVVPLAGLLPMLCVEAVRLWNLPHYRFYPLTLIAFAVLLVLNFRPGLPDQRRLQVGSVSVAAGCVLGLLAIFFFRPAIAHLAAAFLLLGWLAGQLGETRLTRIAALVFLFGTAIPLYGGWDLTVLRGLQTVGADWASGALDAMGILNLQTDAGIASRYFFIPISRIGGGPDSVFFLFSLAAFLIATRWHGAWGTAIPLAFVPLWFVLYAVLCSVVLAAYADSAEQAAAVLPFIPVRIVCLAVICTAMIAFDAAVVSLLRPVGQENTEDEWLVDEDDLLGSEAVTDSSSIAACRYAAAPLSGVLLLAGAAAALMIAMNLPQAFGSAGRSATLAGAIAEANPLPEQYEGWRQVAFATSLTSGGSGVIPVYEWKYARGVEAATFSLIGGGLAESPVTSLERLGWRPAEEGGAEPSGPGEPVQMRNAAGEQAYLIYVGVDADGELVPGWQLEQPSELQTIFTALSDAPKEDEVAYAAQFFYTTAVQTQTMDTQARELFSALLRSLSTPAAVPPPSK